MQYVFNEYRTSIDDELEMNLKIQGRFIKRGKNL